MQPPELETILLLLLLLLLLFTINNNNNYFSGVPGHGREGEEEGWPVRGREGEEEGWLGRAVYCHSGMALVGGMPPVPCQWRPARATRWSTHLRFRPLPGPPR